MKADLTIAICTKDRPDSLLAVLVALSADPAILAGRANVMVIDDGELGDRSKEVLAAIPGRIDILKKQAEFGRGLYESRRFSASRCSAPLILFLDDDAYPDVGYLDTLIEAARSHPDVVGFGGVDRNDLPESTSWARVAYAAAFHLSGRGPGDLSITGFNHGQMLWRSQAHPFPSEFLHGCNMAFRVHSIDDLPPMEWLRGHACCEDLVISRHAASHGSLLVMPTLTLRHMPADGGRGDPTSQLRDRIMNHARFSGYLGRAGAASYAWSMLGLLAKDLLVSRAKRRSGALAILAVYLRAFPEALRLAGNPA